MGSLRLAHPAARGNSKPNNGKRKSVEAETVILGKWFPDLVGSASGSDLEIHRHRQMQTQTQPNIHGRASPRLSLTDRRRVGAPSSTPFRPVMDRLPGTERPYEPIPTSHGTRVKAGATRPAPGGHWEPQKAYRSRNLTRIQVNHEPSAGGHGFLRQTSPTMATLRVGTSCCNDAGPS